MHNAALSSRDLESGFLNLWSVIEVLCISKQSNSKFNEVIKILVPILQKDYIVSLFLDLQEKLFEILSKEDYNNLLALVSEGLTSVEKIAYFVLLQEYEELRKKYYSKLIEYPVIRSRIYEISVAGKSKKELYQLTARYSERVTWHIRRMYRVRNGIVHSGESPKNIKALGEHLHSYVDSLMYEIIGKLSDRQELCTIENVLVDTNFTIQKWHEMFREDGYFDKDTIHQIFSLAHLVM